MENAVDLSLTQTLSDLPSLMNNLLLLLSDKEKSVICKRFSLNNTPKHTLDSIGKEFSVTRERVRQIEKSALLKMKRNVFNTDLKYIHSFTQNLLRKHNGLIREDNLIQKITLSLPQGFKFDQNCLHFPLVLHDNLTCVGNTIYFYPYVRENTLSDYSLKFASNHVINQLHKYGNVKQIDRLHDDLNVIFKELNFDKPFLKSLISINKRITILEEDLVGLLEWKHIHPRTLRDKILYILRKEKKPLHFRTIAEKISSENFNSRPINLQAVHNELIRHDQFILIGRGIYALNEWGYEKGTVCDVIENILKEHTELSQDEIIEKVLEKRQVKKITIILALKNHEKFERTGRKFYCLKKN